MIKIICGDLNETSDHIINECSKLEQKEYDRRYVRSGNTNNWELCKKMEIDNVEKTIDAQIRLYRKRIRFSKVLKHKRIT